MIFFVAFLLAEDKVKTTSLHNSIKIVQSIFLSDEPGEFSLTKRSVNFMGQRVSYPQYLRLVAIQREVIRMDRTIRQYTGCGVSAINQNQFCHEINMLKCYCNNDKPSKNSTNNCFQKYFRNR